MKVGVFPGRFQPFTNAHLDRLQKIRAAYPTMRLFVLVGDVGCVNRENFLLPRERCEMIELVCRTRKLADVFVESLKAAYPPELWVRNVQEAVPDVDTVFSDNPFVFGPLQAAGFTSIVHRREGGDSSLLRELPFENWRPLIPAEAFAYMDTRRLHERLLDLNASGRYPFIGEPAQ